MMLGRYERELRGLLTKAEELLGKDPQDVALADFVTAKRDLRRARQNVAAQLQLVDPDMDAEDIDGFFADVDAIINMKRPGALRATHANIGGVWTKPEENGSRPSPKKKSHGKKSQPSEKRAATP